MTRFYLVEKENGLTTFRSKEGDIRIWQDRYFKNYRAGDFIDVNVKAERRPVVVRKEKVQVIDPRPIKQVKPTIKKQQIKTAPVVQKPIKPKREYQLSQEKVFESKEKQPLSDMVEIYYLANGERVKNKTMIPRHLAKDFQLIKP